MRSGYWSAASYSTLPLGSPHHIYSRLHSNCTQYHHCKWTPSNFNFQLKCQIMNMLFYLLFPNDYYLNSKKKREENVQKGICMKPRPNETGITARLFLLKKQQKD